MTGTPHSETAPLKTPPPLVTNELAVVVVGTALWVVALIVLLLSRDWLQRHDATWWIWVAVAGIGAGLTWGPYGIWKRRAFMTEHGLSDTAPTGEQQPAEEPPAS